MLDRYVYFNPLDRGNLYLIYKKTAPAGSQIVSIPQIGGCDCNYCTCDCNYCTWFQSPRSGKFVSNVLLQIDQVILLEQTCFNPLDRGNLYQITKIYESPATVSLFQSPRSGKFVSDQKIPYWFQQNIICFNPLDRGNLYQIQK